MRNKLINSTVAACVAVLGVSAYAAFGPKDDITLRKFDMLNPSFRIDAPPARGSGTVVHSGPDGTFILTNHHVLAPAEQKMAEAGQVGPLDVVVRNWLFIKGRRNALPLIATATLVADDATHDLALIRIDDPEFSAEPARFIGPDDQVDMTESVYAAGGGLGNRPFITEGLASLETVGDGEGGAEMHTMISAPIIGGNSGGGAYVRRGGHYVLFGVPEAIETTQGGGVPHMGIVIQMSTVRSFLAKAGLPEFGSPNTTVAAR
jgi:S1-C subfamily serine protease